MGIQGNGNIEFDGLAGITTDSSNNLYAVDQNNNRVQKFTNNGTFITGWGSQRPREW